MYSIGRLAMHRHQRLRHVVEAAARARARIHHPAIRPLGASPAFGAYGPICAKNMFIRARSRT